MIKKGILLGVLILVITVVIWSFSYTGQTSGVVQAPQWHEAGQKIQVDAKAWELAAQQPTNQASSLKLKPEDLDKTSFLLQRNGSYRPFVLELTNRKTESRYEFFKPEILFDLNGQIFHPDQPQVDWLQNRVEKLRKQAGFGKLIVWERVDQLFPRYAKATVHDVKSGLEFQVQRRAGSAHADVQPLTAEDAQIMKEIYGGRWSWERRAVVIKLGNHEIAASMNGMPHGAGAIGGNNFKGHFCIHFLESSTHFSGVNLAHQIMVWQASGHLPLLLQNCSQEASLYILLTALDQSDLDLAEQLLTTKLTPAIKAKLSRINRLQIEESKVQQEQVTVEVKYILAGSWQTLEKSLVMQGTKKGAQWNFKPEPLIELVDQPAKLSLINLTGEPEKDMLADLADWD